MRVDVIGDAEIWVGDCIASMAAMSSGSVQTCVTSPPYFGLRDYGCDGQIGLEQTPDEFVAKLVAVFREVRRVLRDDGTAWVNVGDSYSASRAGPQGASGQMASRSVAAMRCLERSNTLPGLKPKDLIGIPWRVAFALQSDGWYLRQDIIWHKPNPMPESVTDRCTKAHEYIFLLSKSARYYYDAAAIAEASAYPPGCGWDDREAFNGKTVGQDQPAFRSIKQTRNRRSVWTVATQPYAGAHFATFPPDLIEPCILAGAPKGGVVLDPFAGSGTTGAVALKHGRKAVLCELNPKYADLIGERLGVDAEQPDMFIQRSTQAKQEALL